VAFPKLSPRLVALIIVVLLVGAGGIGVLLLLPSGPHARFWQSAESLRAGELLLLDARNSSGKAPVVYHWDFGDGTMGDGIQATHFYAQPGFYEIRLVITDAKQRQDEAAKEVTVSTLSVAASPHRLGETAQYMADGHLTYANASGLPLLNTGDPITEIYLTQLSASVSGRLNYSLLPALQGVDGFNQTHAAFAYELASPLVLNGSANLRLFFGTSTVPFSAALNLTLRDLHALSTNLSFRVESTLHFSPVLRGAVPIPLEPSEQSLTFFPLPGSSEMLAALLDPAGGRTVALGENLTAGGLSWTAMAATNVGGIPAITLEPNGTDAFGAQLAISMAQGRSVPVRIELELQPLASGGLTIHIQYDLEEYAVGSSPLPATASPTPEEWPQSIAERIAWQSGQLLPRLGSPPSAAESLAPELVESLLSANATVAEFRSQHPGAAIAEAELGIDGAGTPRWELLLVDAGSDTALRILLENASGTPQLLAVSSENSTLDPLPPLAGELVLTLSSVERIAAQFPELRAGLLVGDSASLGMTNLSYGLAPAASLEIFASALPPNVLGLVRVDGALSAFVDARSGQLVAVVQSTGSLWPFG